MRRISVVINKNWEAEPALNALTSAAMRPAGFPFPQWLNSPKDGNNRMNAPRAVYQLDAKNPIQVTIWCLQDLMNPLKSSSSSEEKYRVLPYTLAANKPDLIIAVGTACYPDEVNSRNGKVIIGSQFFMHNGHPDNPNSNFKTDQFDRLITSNVRPGLFDWLTNNWHIATAVNLLPAPNKPSTPEVLIDQNFVSVGTLNVTDYGEYPTADPASLKAFSDL